MNQIPKVSVILTSYNHAKYLRVAIDSVLSQTYSDFELIIWDDGSVDESWQIITSYADPRIRAFRNIPRKPVGIIEEPVSKYARGEYIAVHHSDDVWEPQKLEKQVAFLDQKPEIGAVFSQAFIINENGDRIPEESHFYYIVFGQPNRTRHEWLNYFFYNGNALCHPSVLIRKKCYDEIGYYRYGLAQLGDFDLWVRLCLKYEIYILPEKLINLRIRDNDANSSGDRPDVRVRGWFEYLQVIRNYKNISDPSELEKVFPIARKYVKPEGSDPGFMLAMAALEVPETYNVTKLFGLELLLEPLNDPRRKKNIEDLYGFTHRNFIELTAKHDVLLVEANRQLNARMAEQDAMLATKNALLAEKELVIQDITNSKAWRLVTFYRALKSKFQIVQR